MNEHDSSKAEPTTAEAFVKVREPLEEYRRVAEQMRSDPGTWSAGEGLLNLALLERRMGSMERALLGCRVHLKCVDGCACDVCAALTDAPPVIGTPCDCPGTPGTHEAGDACLADECAACGGTGHVIGGGQRSKYITVEECGARGGTGQKRNGAPPVFTKAEVEEARLEGFRQGAAKCRGTVAEYGSDEVSASIIYERLRRWSEYPTEFDLDGAPPVFTRAEVKEALQKAYTEAAAPADLQQEQAWAYEAGCRGAILHVARFIGVDKEWEKW